jgi:hypothetical protein
MPRYSRQQLFAIRNHIPIDWVIEALAIPSEHDGGYCRFCCPACNGYNTGTNPQTNLARCFNCQKNYNTIDLVIAVRKLSFIDSVAYLEELKSDTFCPEKAGCHVVPESNCPRKMTRLEKPVAIGDIFRSLATPSHISSEKPLKNHHQADRSLEKRLTALEACVQTLTEKIALIERS